MVPAHLRKNHKSPSARRQGEINNQQSGLTLVELLIVIGVVGILAAGIISALNPRVQLDKARDAQRKNDIANIQKALELFYNDHNSYPTSDATTFQIEHVGGADINWGDPWTENVGATVTYMATLPRDPTSGRVYRYQQVNSGQGYRLYAALERCQPSVGHDRCFDQQACFPPPNSGASTGNQCTNAAGVVDCGSAACTYGKTSSDLSP